MKEHKYLYVYGLCSIPSKPCSHYHHHYRHSRRDWFLRARAVLTSLSRFPYCECYKKRFHAFSHIIMQFKVMSKLKLVEFELGRRTCLCLLSRLDNKKCVHIVQSLVICCSVVGFDSEFVAGSLRRIMHHEYIKRCSLAFVLPLTFVRKSQKIRNYAEKEQTI